MTQATIRLGTRSADVTLNLGPMTCASCANRIERKLNKLDVGEATVNYALEQAAVAFGSSSTDVDALINAVERAGYTASTPRGSAASADDGLDVIGEKGVTPKSPLIGSAILTVPVPVVVPIPVVAISMAHLL